MVTIFWQIKRNKDNITVISNAETIKKVDFFLKKEYDVIA